MCICIGKSEMSDTRIYVGEATRNGTPVHVLAYQNSAISGEPNAMILPFPTSVKMDQDNILDTTKYPTFLKDISEATKRNMKTLGSRSYASFSLGPAAEVFDVGSYTVVLADDVGQIPEALQRVPEHKRPMISPKFLYGFGKLYPNQPIAVCCWSGNIEAEPLLWWYKPTDFSTLFIPTMDAHDGNAPVVGVDVNTDHLISVGLNSKSFTRPAKVDYKSVLSKEAQELLPQTAKVFGLKLDDRLPNGDCFVKTATDKATIVPNLLRDRFHQPMYGWQ